MPPSNPNIAKCETLLTTACARLSIHHGFFAAAVLRKRWRPTEAVPTIGTDGKDLFYNPAWLAQWDVDMTIGLLVHEACHDLGLHPFRKEARNAIVVDATGHPASLWNICCDHQCNQVVQELGLKVPEGGVPPRSDGTPESYYEEYRKNAKAAKGAGKSGCGCTLLDPQGEDGKPLEGAAKAAAEEEARLQAAVTKELAQRAGNVPAALARLVGAALERKVPWEQIVQRFVQAAQHSESCWRKPNRRYLAQGLMLPSHWSPDVPNFVLACDTSGSIDDKTLRQVAGEVLHAQATCFQHGSPELRVVWCDTEVSAQTVACEADIAPKGGGGTMYSPVFNWVRAEAQDTLGVVYVTDGYCSDFGEVPSVPVLWVLTAENAAFQPPFGDVACILD